MILKECNWIILYQKRFFLKVSLLSFVAGRLRLGASSGCTKLLEEACIPATGKKQNIQTHRLN